jgi:hypothetical protein
MVITGNEANQSPPESIIVEFGLCVYIPKSCKSYWMNTIEELDIKCPSTLIRYRENTFCSLLYCFLLNSLCVCGTGPRACAS